MRGGIEGGAPAKSQASTRALLSAETEGYTFKSLELQAPLIMPATAAAGTAPPPPDVLKIGAVAARTGTTTPTIRFYEEIGLLPAAERQAGGQRRYGEDDVRRLTFIRRCREFGFSVEQVRELVALIEDPARSCADARELAHAHLTAVRVKLAELQALKRDMVRFVERCDAECVGGPGPSCVPLAALAHRDGAPTLPTTRDSRPSARRRPARRRA